MKKDFFVLIISIFILSSCVSPSLSLNKHDFKLYNEIIDENIYILDSAKIGKTVTYLSFRKDGSFVSDNSKLFLSKKWKYSNEKKIYIVNDSEVITFEFPKVPFDVDVYEKSIYVAKIKINVRSRYNIGGGSSRSLNYYCIIGDYNLSLFKKGLETNVQEKNDKWKSVNKKSLKDVLEFSKQENISDDLDKEVYPVLLNLVDEKIKIKIKQKYPKLKKYMDYTIVFNNGRKSYQFWELFRNPIVGSILNPINGSSIYECNAKKYGDEIKLAVNLLDGERIITFEIQRNKQLVVDSFRKGYSVNPAGWEIVCAMIFNYLAKYNNVYNTKDFIKNYDFKSIL